MSPVQLGLERTFALNAAKSDLTAPFHHLVKSAYKKVTDREKGKIKKIYKFAYCANL